MKLSPKKKTNINFKFLQTLSYIRLSYIIGEGLSPYIKKMITDDLLKSGLPFWLF